MKIIPWKGAAASLRSTQKPQQSCPLTCAMNTWTVPLFRLHETEYSPNHKSWHWGFSVFEYIFKCLYFRIQMERFNYYFLKKKIEPNASATDSCFDLVNPKLIQILCKLPRQVYYLGTVQCRIQFYFILCIFLLIKFHVTTVCGSFWGNHHG